MVFFMVPVIGRITDWFMDWVQVRSGVNSWIRFRFVHGLGHELDHGSVHDSGYGLGHGSIHGLGLGLFMGRFMDCGFRLVHESGHGSRGGLDRLVLRVLGQLKV